MTQPGATWAALLGALTSPHRLTASARAGEGSGRAAQSPARGGRAGPVSDNGCSSTGTQPALTICHGLTQGRGDASSEPQ